MNEITASTQNHIIQLLPSTPYCVRYTPETDVIGFAYDLQQGVHAFASSRALPFCSTPNSLAYTPKGCDIYSESATGGEYLVIKQKPENLAETSQQHNNRQFNNYINPLAINAAIEIRSLLLSGIQDELILDCNINIMLSAIYDQSHIPTGTGKPASSITPARLKAVHEKIEDELSTPLTIEELAKTSGLSKGYFIRAFKAATGLQPHKYIMSRRIAKARSLLNSTTQNLTQIAHECGFSSHAHMTTAFKRHLGLTPTACKTAKTHSFCV